MLGMDGKEPLDQLELESFEAKRASKQAPQLA
jgi:hypothetical protein